MEGHRKDLTATPRKGKPQSINLFAFLALLLSAYFAVKFYFLEMHLVLEFQLAARTTFERKQAVINEFV